MNNDAAFNTKEWLLKRAKLFGSQGMNILEEGGNLYQSFRAVGNHLKYTTD